MHFNSRDFVVVHIGLRFFTTFSTREGVGVEHRYSKSAHFYGIFFSHNTSLVNILSNNMEQKLFIFNGSFILHQAKGTGP